MIEVGIDPVDLLLWPLALPVHGFTFILEQVRAAADRELYDPETLRRQLLELQMLYESGEVPEDAYRAAWAELGGRLAAAAAANVIGAEEED